MKTTKKQPVIITIEKGNISTDFFINGYKVGEIWYSNKFYCFIISSVGTDGQQIALDYPEAVELIGDSFEKHYKDCEIFYN